MVVNLLFIAKCCLSEDDEENLNKKLVLLMLALPKTVRVQVEAVLVFAFQHAICAVTLIKLVDQMHGCDLKTIDCALERIAREKVEDNDAALDTICSFFTLDRSA